MNIHKYKIEFTVYSIYDVQHEHKGSIELEAASLERAVKSFFIARQDSCTSYTLHSVVEVGE